MTAVVLAGGSGTRFSQHLSKVYVPLGGRPLLQYSLETLEASAHVDHIVVVIRQKDRDAWEGVHDSLGPAKIRAVVPGGATRTDSEWEGLVAASVAAAGTDVVMLHDAARPFVTLDLVRRLVETAWSTGAGVIPAVPLDGEFVDKDGRIVDTSNLVAVQTPQLFGLADLLEAYRRARAEEAHGVDTAQTVQAYCSTPIRHVAGEPRNLKITTPEDLRLAETWVGEWSAGRWR